MKLTIRICFAITADGSEKVKVDMFNANRAQYDLPTNWLWFYVKERLSLSIAVSLFGLIKSLIESDFSQFDGFYIILVMSFLIVRTEDFVGWTFGATIWMVLNLIYFRKRKSLFNNSPVFP